MTIKVEHVKETEYLITWDKNDPKESLLNHYTEEDFINAIKDEIIKRTSNQSNTRK